MSLALRTIDSILEGIGPVAALAPPKAPPYIPPDSTDLDPYRKQGVALAVESMKDHMTDEGWQIMRALAWNRFELAGYNCTINTTQVDEIIDRATVAMNALLTMVVQDEREWAAPVGNFREPKAKFFGMEAAASIPSLFRLTILKDAQHDPHFHKASAEKMQAHGWIIYYHPRIVKHLAPYVRLEHCIRTWHTVDRQIVPGMGWYKRQGSILSGAVSGAYPLRMRLMMAKDRIPNMTYLPHPGYHRHGCATPGFLNTLSKFKVAICTSSRYGYALRKIIEATACGCKVITDLPVDEVLPEIDENLIRVHPQEPMENLITLLQKAEEAWNFEEQNGYAERAKDWYDYTVMGFRLTRDIERLRTNYVSAFPAIESESTGVSPQ